MSDRHHALMDHYLELGGDPDCWIVARRDYEALATREFALRRRVDYLESVFANLAERIDDGAAIKGTADAIANEIRYLLPGNEVDGTNPVPITTSEDGER